MKIFKIIFAILAATAVLAGCAKEITSPSFENDKVNSEGSRVIALSFAPQTKTELDGFQPKFVDNDSILISNGVAIDTCDLKVESEIATISTNLTGPLTAVYPYKAAKMNDSNHNLIDTVLVSTVQDGTFANANICMARMTDEKDESLSFENKTALFLITAPLGTTRLIIKSLKQIETDSGQRTGDIIPVNSSEDEDERYSISIPNGPDKDKKYYVALSPGVNLSDLSFDAEFATAGTGSIKGIPTSKIAQQAAATDKEYDTYNEVQSCTTYNIDENNWHEYVAFSSHKWATMNVGANTPSEFGDYFMWGEIVGHKADLGVNMVYGALENAFSTDFSLFDFSDTDRYTGTVDKTAGFSNCNTPFFDGNNYSTDKYNMYTGKKLLDLFDDGAYANWGGPWRMPKFEEWQTLAYYEMSIVDNHTIRSKVYGNSTIFFPFAGRGFSNDLRDTIDDDSGMGWYFAQGWYWSSSVCCDNPGLAHYISMSYSIGFSGWDRFCGLSIRAIVDEP